MYKITRSRCDCQTQITKDAIKEAKKIIRLCSSKEQMEQVANEVAYKYMSSEDTITRIMFEQIKYSRSIDKHIKKIFA